MSSEADTETKSPRRSKAQRPGTTWCAADGRRTLADDVLPIARVLNREKRPAGFAAPPAKTSDARTLLTAGDEQHVLCVSPTGGGKGRNVLMPILLSDYLGTIVCIDTKAEAVAVTARHQQALGKQVYVIDPFDVTLGRGWARAATPVTLNPMQGIAEAGDQFADDCLALAYDLSADQRAITKESFWPFGGMKYMAGAIGYSAARPHFDPAAPSRAGTLGDVYRFLHGDDVRYATAVILDSVGKHAAFPRLVYEYFAGFLSYEPDKVAPSMLAEAQMMCTLFGSERVQRVTSATTLDLGAFERGDPMVLYIVLPPERLGSHGALIRLWLNMLIRVVTRRSARPPIPTLFLVDEAAHLGRMPLLRDCVTLLRGYGVRVALFLQSLAQLRQLFDDDGATVMQNCGTLITFGQATLSAARQVAEHLGDITGEEVFALRGDELALHRAGDATRIAQRLDYLTDPLFSGRFDPNPYYVHARRPPGV